MKISTPPQPRTNRPHAIGPTASPAASPTTSPTAASGQAAAQAIPAPTVSDYIFFWSAVATALATAAWAVLMGAA